MVPNSARPTAAAGAESTRRRRNLGEAVGREQRREDGGQQDEARDEHQPGDEHAALQSDALAQLVHDGGAGSRSAGGCSTRRSAPAAVRHVSTSPSGR